MKTKTILPVLAALLLAACGKEASAPPSSAAPEIDPRIDALFMEISAEKLAKIPEARHSHSVKDELVLEGRIMGAMDLFVDGHAMFVLGDMETVTPCIDMPDPSHCDTPWDACCDPKELRIQGTATVQVLDEQGQVIPQGLEGVNGLEKLSKVRVKAQVAAGSDGEAFILNALALQVLP